MSAVLLKIIAKLAILSFIIRYVAIFECGGLLTTVVYS